MSNVISICARALRVPANIGASSVGKRRRARRSSRAVKGFVSSKLLAKKSKNASASKGNFSLITDRASARTSGDIPSVMLPALPSARMAADAPVGELRPLKSTLVSRNILGARGVFLIPHFFADAPDGLHDIVFFIDTPRPTALRKLEIQIKLQ